MVDFAASKNELAECLKYSQLPVADSSPSRERVRVKESNPTVSYVRHDLEACTVPAASPRKLANG